MTAQWGPQWNETLSGSHVCAHLWCTPRPVSRITVRPTKPVITTLCCQLVWRRWVPGSPGWVASSVPSIPWERPRSLFGLTVHICTWIADIHNALLEGGGATCVLRKEWAQSHALYIGRSASFKDFSFRNFPIFPASARSPTRWTTSKSLGASSSALFPFAALPPSLTAMLSSLAFLILLLGMSQQEHRKDNGHDGSSPDSGGSCLSRHSGCQSGLWFFCLFVCLGFLVCCFLVLFIF